MPMPRWFLLSTASFRPELDGVKDYEVITPVRLHTLHRRDTQMAETVFFPRGLLAEGYSETTYTQDGTPVTSTPQNLDDCYYHGRIVNDSESTVSLSTCDGLRGYFRTAARQYLIEPLSGAEDGAHALFKYEAVNAEPPVCGVTNSSWEPVYPPLISKSRSRSSGLSPLQQQKYVELYLVADNREYKKMNSDINEVRKRIFEIVNYVNVVYKPLKTFIALIGLEIWTDQDKISVTTPAGSTLDAFTNWRNNYLLKTKPHDNAHLISGIDFDGATVGLAYIGSLCTGHSTGVVQDHNSRAIAVGATLAHEMGHNLGMNHDSSSCICTGSTCIMSAALSYDIPENFSSCSDANYEQFLTSRNPPCLFNKPDYMSLISTPKCGNGFVENGEQCDCGTVEECKNPCCNATTCTLTAGSQCSAGDCCEDCKVMCRRQQDECDLAEYCTGKSTECPEDVFTVNGLPCKGGQSYCYNGLCPTKADQCVKVWGSTAEVAKPSCYDQNTRGTYYAFCNRPSREQYIGCQKKDVMCGKLFCIEGNDNPNYNRFVKFLDCKAIFSDDPDNDFGQVDTGTKCGDGMVCKDHECVNLETAYRATNCSARCKGHAVCNHKQECQCEPGWLPPNCDSKEYTPLSPGTCVDSGFIYCQILPKCLISMKERRLMLPV
uniref:ADAM metallopeptidase domain 28 n=1 Tax=Scleropages formosus TaxID=113540 RepID=A0A8C9VI83_SCLFO